MFNIAKEDVARYYQICKRDKTHITSFDVIRVFFGFKLTPVLVFRMINFFYRKKIPILGKLLSLVNFIFFGIEIANNCCIGGGFFIPHSQGIVIGATSIGKNATIYQQVTLGAKNIDIPFNPQNRPSLGDNVVVASGAKVLGGIVIGNNVIIAANAVVTKSVEDNVVLAGIPATVIKRI